VCTGAADGEHLVGLIDGTVLRLDGSGGTIWSSANPGMTVTALSTSARSRVTLALVSPSAGATSPGFSAALLIDGDGRASWQALGTAADTPVDGRLSLDGETVLLLSAASSPAPATVTVRDASTGSVHWERRIRGAFQIVGDASSDLRSIVVGYAIRHSDHGRSTGVIESYRDGRMISSMPHSAPAFPALLGSKRLVVADVHGAITCRTWSGTAIGTAHWCAAAAPGTLLTGGDRLAICTHSREHSEATVTEVTTIRVYTSDGTAILHKEVRAAVPYLPTLSRDGGLLALIPREPTPGENPLFIRLEEPALTTILPENVTAIDFGAAAGCMLVGAADGSVGVACVPD